jgi:hypothetical protein
MTLNGPMNSIDSDREAVAPGASSYAMRASLVPPAFEQFGHRTANHAADPVVEVSPPDAVSRRTASGPGVAVEIVHDNRRGRIDYRYCSSRHMLVVHERGVRHDGCTLIEGLPKSTLQDCSGKLVFVPAGHKYHDWHEPRTLSRVVFFYFNPIQLAISPLGYSRMSLSPRIFFEDNAIMQSALKLVTLIEGGDSDHRQYLEALGVVLSHELVRINKATQPAELRPSGGLAAWQRRKAVAYIEEHLAEPISLEALARAGWPERLLFLPGFSSILGAAAATLSVESAHRTRQDAAGKTRRVSHRYQSDRRLQRHERVLHGVSPGHRPDS